MVRVHERPLAIAGDEDEGQAALGEDIGHRVDLLAAEIDVENGGMEIAVGCDLARLRNGADTGGQIVAELVEQRAGEREASAGLAAGVAHEVNNPLASISSLVQSLLTGEDDPTRRSTLHTILTQITRISGTLKDLVNFARPSTAHRQAVDLNALIEETLRLVSYNKRFSGITLKPELASDLTPAHVDNNEVQQVLLNLIRNAVTYTPEGGSVTVSASVVRPSEVSADRTMPGNLNTAPAASLVQVSVSDTGAGIPVEHLPHVFERFYRAGADEAQSGGLGLAIAQAIVGACGGTIECSSRPGAGTRFTVRLPAVPPETNLNKN